MSSAHGKIVRVCKRASAGRPTDRSGRCAVSPMTAYAPSLCVYVSTAPAAIYITTMSINHAPSCSQLGPNFTANPLVFPLTFLAIRARLIAYEGKRGTNYSVTVIPSFLRFVPAISSETLSRDREIDIRSPSKRSETQRDIRCFIVTPEKTRSIAAATPPARVT